MIDDVVKQKPEFQHTDVHHAVVTVRIYVYVIRPRYVTRCISHVSYVTEVNNLCVLVFAMSCLLYASILDEFDFLLYGGKYLVTLRVAGDVRK